MTSRFVVNMECQQFRFVISLLLLLTTSSFDAFFKSDPSSATAKKLLAALPRPRFGGPVIASKADPATRELQLQGRQFRRVLAWRRRQGSIIDIFVFSIGSTVALDARRELETSARRC